jgi:hypothetical protein
LLRWSIQMLWRVSCHKPKIYITSRSIMPLAYCNFQKVSEKVGKILLRFCYDLLLLKKSDRS